ncbi:MAG: hypothetical protein IJQ87_04910 [Clostridia bacterium]|nr:hypothetical protein [Clostridia bacterium]
MMKLFGKLKIWIIVAVITVLLGALLLSIFGLNQTPDYKSSYEASVSVDQNVNGSGELVDKTARAYFGEKGYRLSDYATQKTEDGDKYIYKFHKAGDIDKEELQAVLQTALDNDAELGALNLVASAEYGEVKITSDYNAGKILLACLLGLIVAFAVSFFTVKLASALTVVCNAVMTLVIYTMLVAITRIPALPDFAIVGGAAMLLSVVMTFVITCRYKEKLKLDEKADVAAVASDGVKDGFIRLCFITCAVILAAALLFVGGVYFLFIGLKLILAAISAYLVSCVATPALWTVFKKLKIKK